MPRGRLRPGFSETYQRGLITRVDPWTPPMAGVFRPWSPAGHRPAPASVATPSGSSTGPSPATVRKRAFEFPTLKVQGEERLVVVQEIQRTHRRTVHLKQVVDAIRALVTEEHGVDLHALLLVRPGAVHITSSGKVRHLACKADFMSDGFEPVHRWSEDGSGASDVTLQGQLEDLADIVAATCNYQRKAESTLDRMRRTSVAAASRKASVRHPSSTA